MASSSSGGRKSSELKMMISASHQVGFNRLSFDKIKIDKNKIKNKRATVQN